VGRKLEWEGQSGTVLDGEGHSEPALKYSWEVVAVTKPGPNPILTGIIEVLSGGVKQAMDLTEMKQCNRGNLFRCDVETTRESVVIGGKTVMCIAHLWTDEGSGDSSLTTHKIWLCAEVPGVEVKSELATTSRFCGDWMKSQLVGWK
jgi:hypothetical protein